MKKYKYIYLSLLTLTPMVSFAALGGVKSLITTVGQLINSVIPIVFGLAVLYFFWGLIQFIQKAGDEHEREAGKQRMLWGIIALFVIVSIFGILQWVGNTLGIEQGGLMDYLGGGGTGGACINGTNPVDGTPCN